MILASFLWPSLVFEVENAIMGFETRICTIIYDDYSRTNVRWCCVEDYVDFIVQVWGTLAKFQIR